MGDLERTLLELVSVHQGPVGQGALNSMLRERGFSISAPTVGRKLQKLERMGLLRKVSVEGRVITEKGVGNLTEWNHDATLRISGEALQETLKREDKKNILQLLHMRRVIEAEAASLAATHASRDA